MTRNLDLSIELGRQLCERWGLNPQNVRSIRIDICAYELPTATVTLLLNEGTIEQLLHLTVTPPDEDGQR